MKKISLKFVLICLGVLPLLVGALIINLRAVSMINKLTMSEIEAKLHTTVDVAAQHFDEMAESGDGSWVVGEDGVLTIGGVAQVQEDDDYFGSALSEDVYLTLFMGDTRYGTSIKDQSGKLVIGTKASDAVIAEVLNGGQNKFIDHVEIVGEDFSGYYVPLKDGSGQTIGMMFAGAPYTDTQKEINKNVYSLLFILVLSVVIFGAVAILVATVVNKRINTIAAHINDLSDGDFATPVIEQNKIKELADITDNLETMRGKLGEVIGDIIDHANAVEASANVTEERIADSQKMSEDINNAVYGLAQGASSMAENVQDTSDLTLNIGNSVNEVLNSAQANIEMADAVYQHSIDVQHQLEHLKDEDKETDAKAGEVQDSVNETARVVDEISTAAEAIINIASQTNLLALNASIEAARAGEAGKGFAVVADSIKELAAQSNESAKEITDMLARISALSEQNKMLTQTIKEATSNESVAFDHMSDSFDDMEHQLEQTEEGNKAIAALVESVNKDKDAIMDAIESLSSISEENAASTEETSASLSQLTDNMESIVGEARELKNIAGNLKNSISFFRV
ncbi:MAG: cache domain-containing protein [Lachnospiraceae bacterium]|nr:cache domain-containing protein [Lachnospiraceae bacterium]